MERERTSARLRQRRATDEKAAMPCSIAPPPVAAAVVGGCIESPASDERLLSNAPPFNSDEHLYNIDNATSALRAGLEAPPPREKKEGTQKTKKTTTAFDRCRRPSHREAPRLSDEEELDDELEESESEPDELEEEPDDELDEDEPEEEPPSLSEELEEELEPSEPSSSSPEDDASQKRDFCASA